MTSYARFLDVAADNSNEKNAVKDLMVSAASSTGTGGIQSKPMQNVHKRRVESGPLRQPKLSRRV